VGIAISLAGLHSKFRCTVTIAFFGRIGPKWHRGKHPYLWRTPEAKALLVASNYPWDES
jgi:hypothetical protein